MLTKVFEAFFHSRQSVRIDEFTIQQTSSNSRILLCDGIRLLEYSEEHSLLTIEVKKADNLFVIALFLYISDDVIPMAWIPNFDEENNSLEIITYGDGQIVDNMIFNEPTRLFIHHLCSLHDKELNPNVTVSAIPYALSGPTAAVSAPTLDSSAYIEGVL